MVLEKTLESPWTARRSKQSILKEISPGISLEGIMLKLKLQYFGHLMRRVDSLEKTLMLGGIGGRKTCVKFQGCAGARECMLRLCLLVISGLSVHWKG